jgi:hypothetical protein
MKKSYASVALIAVALLLGVVGVATAQLAEEPVSGYAGHYHIDLVTGNSWWDSPNSVVALGGDIYNNTASPANFGFSLTDLAAIFGDRVTTTGLGVLDENDFSVFNSGSSAGNLLTASYAIQLSNATTSAPLGGYTTGIVSFGTGLPPGFFTIISVIGLNGLGINLNTNDVLITQQIATHTGLANRMGIASLDPPTIGSSSNVMFINSVAVGPPGYYNIGNPPLNANPGYRINVELATSTRSSTWGRMKALYR